MDVAQTTQTLTDFATTYGIKIVGAILILIAGRIIAGALRRGVRKMMSRGKGDPTLTHFFASLVYYLVITFTVLAALGKFGVETASLVAVLGATGFAIGFAMQGSLSNFAAGVLLLVFRPYKVGDFVDVAGVAGSVKEIGLFNTTMTTPDNVRIIVPNGKIFGDVIKNFSAEDLRRVDMTFGIGYGSSIPRAIEIIEGLLEADARVLPEPALQIVVAELADSSVNIVVRPWAKKEDYWGLKFDMTHRVKEAFDAAGIEIPFPQRVVHNIAVAGRSA
ncbi:MAG: mechanosensitive ion channel [Candidatus Krumholzibacteriota bacterium]|nr:mechanosensitive ion channel [Candidatus Krumholzibacteriota bacterium]